MDFGPSVTRRHATSDKARRINGAEIRADDGLTGALTAEVAEFPAWR